jgi:hypothetical protein
MLTLDYVPLACLSMLWRVLSLITIGKFLGYESEARACVFGSTLKAHLGTWTAWLLTSLYFVSTVKVRPDATWIILAIPSVLAVAILVTFFAFTCRAKVGGPAQQDLFLGAPIVQHFPSASNVLVVDGMLADLMLLILRSGWLS